MLQWMGGSRRKVTASRKSTHKRQKQYFEQRRRQQHHHQEAGGGGSYSERNRTFGEQIENNRSLDILSLLNLSALAQEHKSGCPIREKSEDDALNCRTLPHLPVVQSNDIRRQEHSGIEETRTSSSYQIGTACPKMISTSAPFYHAETLKTDDDKMTRLKMALDCQLSLIDILEDDDTISGCKNSLAQEAHVAFSIEGLGTVETKTPVHSPEAHTRSFLDGCSSPSKATNIANPSRDLTRKMVNLECELDALMGNIGSPFCRSSVDQPFCSGKSVGLFSKKKKKIDFEKFSLFNDSNYSSDDLLGDDKLFCRSKANKESIWNDSGIFAGNILEESDFHLSDKNWMYSLYPCAAFLNTMDFRKEDFEHFTQQEKRTTIKKGGRLGSIECPATNFKYQKSENVSNLIPTDVTWDSSIGRDHGDLKDEFGESCFITNIATESLSLPSEESCSSIAERGRRTLLNFKDKLVKRDYDDIFLSESVCSEKDIPPRERYCNESNTLLEENIYVPGNFTRISNPSTSMQVPELDATPKKRLKPYHSRYFEAEYELGVQNSCRNSFSETSETTKHVSPVCGLWTEDLLHTIGDAEESNRSCLERLSKSSAKCSPGCNFISDTHDFGQPNLLNISGSSIQNVFQDSALGDKSHKTLDVHGCLTPENEKIPRQADAYSEVQISDYGKFQLQRDDLSGNKSSSSDNGASTGLSDSQIEHRDCEGPTCNNPKMRGESESKMNCFQQIDNMPSFETSKIFKGKQCNADRKCQFTQTSLLRQTGFEEVEDVLPKQRVTSSDALSTADSTCQVTVFDNRVVQLFCVQVLKEVSAKIFLFKASKWWSWYKLGVIEHQILYVARL